jgi:hypothetical protein
MTNLKPITANQIPERVPTYGRTTFGIAFAPDKRIMH